jgi:ATP-dependent Lon protease
MAGVPWNEMLGSTNERDNMKLEIEITEEELRSAVERKVRTAVADQTNQWNVDSYIKEQVKAHWHSAVDALVQEALNDSKTLREKIAAELEKKLRAQLAAALKNAA